jgi:hypothetical protein
MKFYIEKNFKIQFFSEYLNLNLGGMQSWYADLKKNTQLCNCRNFLHCQAEIILQN